MSWGHPNRDKVALFVGDIVLIVLAVLAGHFLFFAPVVSGTQEIASTLLFLLALLAALYVLDLYSLATINGLATFVRVVLAAVAAGGFCGIVFHLLSLQNSVYPLLQGCVFFLPIVIYAWRRAYFHSSRKLRSPEKILVLGNANDAITLLAAMDRFHPRYQLVGLLRAERHDVLQQDEKLGAFSEGGFHSGRADSSVAVATMPVAAQSVVVTCETGEPVPDLGPASTETLLRIVEACEIDLVVVRSDAMTLELAGTLTRLRFNGTRVYSLLDFCMYSSEELPLDVVSDFWLCVADGFDLLQARVFRRLKRLFDIFLAVIGLVIALPFMLLAAIAIRLDSNGPILYRQERVGWMGRTFELLKFRSMEIEAERGGPQWAAQNDPRVTRVGRLLRKTHFDELPQMINILRGEMSFVGPRPERPEFVRMLNESINFYHLRHYVLPGITGWAQVNYRYGASLEDAKMKLQYDLYYVCKASPLLDLRTLLRTARVVVFRQGSR